MRYSTCALSFDSHEFPHKLCNFIRCGVQGKMAGIENVNLGCGNVVPIRLRFSQFKRLIIFPHSTSSRGCVLRTHACQAG